jgi:hypothetical protein
MYHFCTFSFNFSKTANGVLCDTVHRLYQHILYFQDVTISQLRCKCNFNHVCKKLFAALHQLSQNPQMLNSDACGSLTQNFTKTGQYMWKVWTEIQLWLKAKYTFH